MDLRRRVMRIAARKADRDNMISQIVLLAIMPLAVAFMGVVHAELWKVYPIATVVAWIFVIFMYVVFVIRNNIPHRAHYLLASDNEAKENDIGVLSSYAVSLQDAINYQSNLGTLILNWRRMSTAFALNAPQDPSLLLELFSDMLSPLQFDGGELFGFLPSERWNFVIYIYSPTQDLLMPVWRTKSLNHPAEGLGREWGRGRGHVGKAFVDLEPKITPDSRSEEVANLMKAPKGEEKGYDDNLYVSFASMPIGPMPGGVSDDPYGVLVATSDQPGRFNGENSTALFHAAETLASLFSLIRIDQDAIIEAAKPRRAGTHNDQSE